ncbi:hypothetical protein BO99DRAFT_95659 [Aspergillus violaceofuscus CBS 115571]|uniref:Uncharacterized protein n=1 Tax=Aspergillus violaceofuscus (strain CBS 115571) TaxID=1450538 RepID=A0A2V5HBN4_ASPV1|nr:hypothetical protein BO99DRAFT_95659 [Aspergillus violaceofuscus CBS 115571]
MVARPSKTSSSPRCSARSFFSSPFLSRLPKNKKKESQKKTVFAFKICFQVLALLSKPELQIRITLILIEHEKVLSVSRSMAIPMNITDTKRVATSSEDDRRCSVHENNGRSPQAHRQQPQNGQTTRGTRLQSLPKSAGQGRDRAPAPQKPRHSNSRRCRSQRRPSQVSNDEDVVMRDVSGQATQGMRLQSLPNYPGQGRDRAPAPQKPHPPNSRRCRSQRRPSQVSNDQDVVMRDVFGQTTQGNRLQSLPNSSGQGRDRAPAPQKTYPPNSRRCRSQRRPSQVSNDLDVVMQDAWDEVPTFKKSPPRSILKVSNDQDRVMKDAFLPPRKVHFAEPEHLPPLQDEPVDVEMVDVVDDSDVEMGDADVEMEDAPELPWWVCDVLME